MRKLRGNSTTLFLLILVILSSYPLYTTAAIRTFSHNEEIDYGPILPRLWDKRVTDDGTLFMRVIRRNPNVPAAGTTACFMEMVSLRIINTDGTVIEKDYKNLGIPSLNYCVQKVQNQIFDPIKYDVIRKNQLLITYYNATDVNDLNTYSEWGIIIDLDGNILDRTIFGLAYITPDDTTQRNILAANSQVQLNINREKGFLRINGKTGSHTIEWQQYRIEPNGVFTKLTFGDIEFNSVPFVTPISTVDENYAIVFANATNNFNATNPLSPQGQLFILPIGFNQASISPLLLYQTPIPNLRFTSIICNVAFVGVGEVCTLTALQIDPAGTLPNKTFYIKVNFLSSGSVSSFQVINNVLNIQTATPIWVVNSLSFGGYLLINSVAGQPTQTSLVGYLFQENSDVPIPWEFPEPQPSNIRGLHVILPNNNTLLIAQAETSNSWGFQIIDLPKFSGDRDKGYSNLNIESTVPSIQSDVNPDLDKITINFYGPVEISTGKLSIYHVDGGQTYLRQSLQSGTDSLNVENNDKTITGKILDSTFSIKGNYYIQMDNNFVRNQAYKEPMLGIRENVWTFTIEERKDRFSPSTTGLLRLTTEGTRHYDSLSSGQQSKFFDDLLNDLSYAIPITRSRLSSNQRIQVDNSVNEKQYLISVGIKETRDENDLSVATVVKNLGTLVTNKDQTPIGDGQTTRYLDENYSFVPSPNLWEKYKFRLLGVFLIVGLLMVLFLFAQRRDSNGNNIAILQLGVIIFDLVMDILFVSSNARDVSFLYIPSVIFITVPIGLNTILAFSIITQENNTNTKFLQWFTAHGKVASVFTVLAGADIEALNILHSNLAGFPFFRAPFSDDAKSKIFWGACINIFTEDIPQVIIQILYRYYTVSYDNLIPLLTLVSSAVNLTINIIGRLYQGTNRLRNKDGSNYDNNDPDDFGGLVSSSSDNGSNNKKDLEKLEEGESTTREIPVSESSSQKNYLGDVLKLDNSDEKLGLDAVLKKSYNENNDSSKNQGNKGITFLKRMVSRKE